MATRQNVLPADSTQAETLIGRMAGRVVPVDLPVQQPTLTGGRVEPTLGFEPRTCCLRSSSAQVLWHGRGIASVGRPVSRSSFAFRGGRALRDKELDENTRAGVVGPKKLARSLGAIERDIEGPAMRLR
jgi:hypothetical protein